MTPADVLERLKTHKLLGTVPESERRWIADHHEFKHVSRGGFYVRKGDAVDHMWILLTGHMAIYVDRGLGPRRVTEWHGGDISGWVPYSRIARSPGDVIALEPSDCVLIDKRWSDEVVRECPETTAKLVHEMLDRTRRFTESERQDEKMVSLGRMAAGLAHELNNPASAIRRTSQLLASHLEEAENAARILAGSHLTTTQLDALDRARRVCGTTVAGLSPLERADREDSLVDWLDAHGANTDIAGALVDTGATPDSLQDLSTALDGEVFDTALEWISASCNVRALTREIDTASSRIHDLVSAFKRASYMDQAQVPEAMDLTQGLRDTVSLMQPKARERSVSIVLQLETGLPRVTAIGSQLNQVWTNLIDNALDAAPSGGIVRVTAQIERGGVIVRIIDNGAGIPDSIREKIFDQFFTTKGVGKGTGLGLEITRRLVHQMGGDIEFDSEPGHTEFRVMLKVAVGNPQ